MKEFKLVRGNSLSLLSLYTSQAIGRLTENILKGTDLADTRPDIKIMLIVPDQYTMTAEKYYVKTLGEKKAGFINIISFKRLFASVIASRGGMYKQIGTGGKSALIMKSLAELDESLKFYRDCYSINFISEVSEGLREMKSYRISPEKLYELSMDNDKFYDLSLIYSAYDSLMKNEYIDPDDCLKLLSEIIIEDNLFKDTHIFIDCFKILTASELGVIESMFACGSYINMSLVLPETEDDYGLFSPIFNIYKHINKFVLKCGGRVVSEILPPENGRKSEALSFLAENINSRTFKINENTYGISEDVVFYKASGPADEIDFIASEISRLTRNNGYRYRDFALVTNDTFNYSSYIETSFSEYGIPVFFHKKTPLKQKVPAKFVLSVLDILTDGYTQDNVFELLKTGILPVDFEDITEFIQYVTIWGIRYNKFLKPFTRSVRGFAPSQAEDAEDSILLKRINNVRVSLIGLTEPLREKTKNADVRKISEALFDILREYDIEGHIKSMGEGYARYGETALHNENMQVYELIIECLDELVSVAGDEKITIRKYRDLIMSVIDSKDINIIPTSLDEVLCSDADTAPLFDHKCVFVFGLCDGEFPSACADDGLINDKDREILEENGIKLGLKSDERYLYECFVAYLCMTSASEKLYLSYPAVDGSEKSPSQMFCDVRRLFPENEIKTAPLASEPHKLRERIQSEKPAFSMLSKYNIVQLEEYFRTTPFGIYLDNKEYSGKDYVSLDTAHKLFGSDISIAAGKMSVFYSCRFRYFFKYGLNLKIRENKAFNSLNTGSFIHAMLERVFRYKDWIGLSDSDLKNLIEKCAFDYMKSVFAEDDASASFKIYISSLCAKFFRLLLSFREELNQSEFVPRGFEISVSEGGIPPVRIMLEKGAVRLTGKIDRLDVYEHEGRSYIRIIDYKSGSRTFDLGQVYSGIDVQLLMYLYSVKSASENTIPAGAVYVNVKPSIISLKRGENIGSAIEEAEKKRRRTGLILDNEDVIRAMDRDMCCKYIPLKTADDRSSRVTEKEFDLIFKHIKCLLKKMGDELHRGHMYKNPVKYKSSPGVRTSCDYCEIKGVCDKAGEAEYIPAFDKDGFIEELKNEK